MKDIFLNKIKSIKKPSRNADELFYNRKVFAAKNKEIESTLNSLILKENDEISNKDIIKANILLAARTDYNIFVNFNTFKAIK